MLCASSIFFIFAASSLLSDVAHIDGTMGWLDNGVMKLGIDKNFGGAIVYISHSDSSINLVNIHDHGRLIQQSYYAGPSLDRIDEGQHPNWSPWRWNPVQGGNWAGDSSIPLSMAVINEGMTLYSETQPRLWDMGGELAQATMQQWMQFEPGMNNVIRVDNRLVSWRDPDDLWGGPVFAHQECPAVYLIRDMDKVVMYDGDEPWQNQPLTTITEHEPAPPWSKHYPTEHWVACVYPENNFGVGIYSTYDDQFWYVGAVGSQGGTTSAATMHVAPINGGHLDRDAVWDYTYWIIIGDVNTIRARAYELNSRPSPPSAPPLSDINRDGRVDLQDLSALANVWLLDSCLGPFWCDRADLNRSGHVGLNDLAILVDEWCFNR